MSVSIKVKIGNRYVEGVKQSGGVLVIVDGTYSLGDFIEINVPKAPCYLSVQLDNCMSNTTVYVTKSTWRFYIPKVNFESSAYPFNAFAGVKHFIYVSEIKKDNLGCYNLALNPYDVGNANGIFPHASSNSETRGEQIFLARNAIDGVEANGGHEQYPFESWGPEVKKDICYEIEFGRLIKISSIDFVFRNDLPHDGYWSQFDLYFDDEIQNVENYKNQARISTNCNGVLTKKISLKNFDFEKSVAIDQYYALSAISVWGTNK